MEDAVVKAENYLKSLDIFMTNLSDGKFLYTSLNGDIEKLNEYDHAFDSRLIETATDSKKLIEYAMGKESDQETVLKKLDRIQVKCHEYDDIAIAKNTDDSIALAFCEIENDTFEAVCGLLGVDTDVTQDIMGKYPGDQRVGILKSDYFGKV